MNEQAMADPVDEDSDSEGRYDNQYEESAEEMREREAKEQIRIRLDAFGLSLARTRSDAIGWRMQSGIEEIWREDREFFEGVDDLNRGDERSIRTDKPLPGGGGIARSKVAPGQSRVFPNITGPFVESAAAHVSDILLPTEEPPWKLEPTPIPQRQELAEEFAKTNPEEAQEKAGKGFLARISSALGMATNSAESRDAAMMDQGAQDPGKAFELEKLAEAQAEATQKRIWDWHVECQFTAQVRRAIEEASKIGTGIIKGPIPREQLVIGWESESEQTNELGAPEKVPGSIKLTRESKPITKWVDPSNLFPARGCGESIQNGDYCWERDFLTKRQLRQLAKDNTFLAEQIQLCLEEGPSRAIAIAPEAVSTTTDAAMEGKYEIWYYYGQAEREDLTAACCDIEGLEDPYIDVLVMMVNNRVIKASLPELDFGGFPYDVFCWRKRANFWAGIGVGRQVRTAQKMIVGGTRAMMNNAGLAGGPMIVFKQGVVRPADGIAAIAPRKVFYIAKDDQTIADATKAIGTVKVDIYVDEMLAIIRYALQLAENNSGFPLLTQGQMGEAPDLVGVVNVLDRNTNAIKRRIGRNFSDDVMNPHIRRYYIFHLMYGPDNEKGDLQINVKGYASLVERDIQNQMLGQLGSIVVDPRFGLDPKKWVVEYLKSLHLNAEDLKIDDEEWGKMLEQWQEMMAQQGDPRVQVAKINAQSRLEDSNLKAQAAGAIQLNKSQVLTNQAEMDRKLALVLAQFEHDLQMAIRTGASQDQTMKLKTDLAKEVMKINSVFKLAHLEAPASAMPEPPVEPAGTAPAGESYQK